MSKNLEIIENQATYKKRKKELKIYFEEFKANFDTEINFCDNPEELVCSLYFKYLREIIRPALKKKEQDSLIQNFKIAAGMELTILQIAPIKCDDFSEKKVLNASLAFYVALRFIIEWDEELNSNKCNKVLSEDLELKEFVNEHFRWLTLVDPTFVNPLFVNSHVWRLFYYLLRDRVSKLK